MRAVNHGCSALLVMALLLAGCATHEIKVDCDGKLQPINTLTNPKVAQRIHGPGESDVKSEVAQ